jgi:hypothetical protein
MKRIGNEKGFVLVAAIAITMLVMILGATAIKMSELGYLTYGSERRYQVANTAAEYAVNAGIKYVHDNSACPAVANCSGTLTTGGVSANYSCFSINAGYMCFIHTKGTFGGATVVKTAAIPAASNAPYGALTLRHGGTVDLSGSSSIGNCDSGCMSPGILAGGTLTLPKSGSTVELHNYPYSTCPNNPNGAYGQGAAQNKDGITCTEAGSTITCSASANMTDLIPTLFNSSNWADLVGDMSLTYSGYTVNVGSLSVAGLPNPTAPTPTCTCTGNVTLTTTSSNCTGVANLGACGGNVTFSGTGNHTIQGIPAGINNIVSAGNVSVTSVPSASGNFAGKSIYTTGTSKNITINDSDVSLSNSTLSSSGQITLSNVNSVANSIIKSVGNMSITGTISDTTIQTTSSTAGEIILTGATISNSMVVRSGVFDNSGDAIYVRGGTTLSNTTLVSPDEIHVESTVGTMTNSNLFTDCMPIDKGGGTMAGGLLYTQGNTWFQGSGGGNQSFGTEANPTLFIQGGNLNIQHGNGSIDMYGLIFNNGDYTNATAGVSHNGAINYTGNGNFTITGAMVGNSALNLNSIGAGGNATISFDAATLNLLSTKWAGLVRSASCYGGGGRASFINTTKVTVY